MSNHIFTGSGVALITPMKSDGSVNYDVLGDLVEFHVQKRYRRNYCMRYNR